MLRLLMTSALLLSSMLQSSYFSSPSGCLVRQTASSTDLTIDTTAFPSSNRVFIGAHDRGHGVQITSVSSRGCFDRRCWSHGGCHHQACGWAPSNAWSIRTDIARCPSYWLTAIVSWNSPWFKGVTCAVDTARNNGYLKVFGSFITVI